jgi:hypothetical protein
MFFVSILFLIISSTIIIILLGWDGLYCSYINNNIPLSLVLIIIYCTVYNYINQLSVYMMIIYIYIYIVFHLGQKFVYFISVNYRTPITLQACCSSRRGDTNDRVPLDVIE